MKTIAYMVFALLPFLFFNPLSKPHNVANEKSFSKVFDNCGMNKDSLQINVKRVGCEPILLSIIVPTAGQIFNKGLAYPITYSASNLGIDIEFDGVLYYYLEGISLSYYSMVAVMPQMNNPYSWFIPTNIPTGTYRLKGVVNWRCPKGAGDWQGYSFTSANFNIN